MIFIFASEDKSAKMFSFFSTPAKTVANRGKIKILPVFLPKTKNSFSKQSKHSADHPQERSIRLANKDFTDVDSRILKQATALAVISYGSRPGDDGLNQLC